MESKIVMNDDVEQCNQQTKEIESSEKEIRKIFKDGCYNAFYLMP